jgi:hypothetical protein
MASDYVGDVIHVLADGSTRRGPLYSLHSRTVGDVGRSVPDEGSLVLLRLSLPWRRRRSAPRWCFAAC